MNVRLFSRASGFLIPGALALLAQGINAQTAVPWAFDVQGEVEPGSYVYFQATVPEGHTTGWRLRLDGHAGADLYIRAGQAPTVSNYLQRSINQEVETIALLPAQVTAGATYWIGVHLPAAAAAGPVPFRLTGDAQWATDLPWDAGLTDAGDAVAPADTRGGISYYRAVVPAGHGGVWRTRLEVTAGEADLYFVNGTSLPGPGNASASSTRIGSDGWLRAPGSVGQVLSLAVHASAGAEWTLVSGEAYAQPLPAVGSVDPAAADGAPNAPRTAFTIPPEGGRYFRVTAAASLAVPAWRVWAYRATGGGGAATLTETIQLRRGSRPFATSRDHQQAGQMLIVPSYLTTTAEEYFLHLAGEPQAELFIDSRAQLVEDLPFRSAADQADPARVIQVPAAAANGAGFGYRTFRVEVPVDRLGWELTLAPDTGGPGGIAVARSNLPNEWFNEAFIDGAAGVAARLTLVPPILVNGTWYVTVWGTGPWSGTLSSRPPQPPEIAFSDQDRTTAEPNRPGWHYFVLNDIEAQLGSLGWELKLDDAVAGAEIAVRANALPSRWNYRTGYTSGLIPRTYVDASTTTTLLQRPAQPVEVWYVGIYHPTQPVGAFALDASPIVPTVLDAALSEHSTTGQLPGTWQFFRYDVGPQHDAWELQLLNATAAGPELVIRRGLLPPGGTGVSHGGSSFPAGGQLSGTSDLTRRSTSADGLRNWEGTDYALLRRGMPLDEGTYYVGVRNGASEAASWTLRSRGIGAGLAYAPEVLATAEGEVSYSDLGPREWRTVAVDVPAGQRSWVLRVTPTRGEVVAHLARGLIPGSDSSPFNTLGIATPSPSVSYYKAGEEHLVLLAPSNADFLPAGRYFVTAVAEGEGPVGNRIGTGTVDVTVRSEGPLAVTDLGLIEAGTEVVEAGAYAAGGVRAYRFSVPAGLNGLELTLANVVGDPNAVMSLVLGDRLPSTGTSVYRYQALSGASPLASNAALIALANPAAADYLVVVGNGHSHYFSGVPADTEVPAATFDLRLVGVGEDVLPFNGGLATVVDQPAGSWRYYRVTVPETGPEGDPVVGWEVRLQEASGASLELQIRRDLPPPGTNLGHGSLTWASGSSVTGTADLTGRSTSADGSRNWDGGSTALLAMGRPLQPGLYYVGVRNSASVARSWTLRTRGVGVGLDLDVTELAFAGGEATVTDVAARDLRFFAVDIPEGQRSWVVRAEPTAGEVRLAVAGGAIPGTDASFANSIGISLPTPTLSVYQSGAENLVLFPPSTADFLTPGRYYVAVVSEGEGPTAARIGTGAASATVRSLGGLAVADLGALQAGEDLGVNADYGPGEVRAFRFSLPAGLIAVEVAVEDKTGDAELQIALREGLRMASLGGVYTYAPRGGATPFASHGSIVTRSNPTAGDHVVLIGSSDSHYFTSNSGDRVGDSATFRLRITAVTDLPLALDGGMVTVTDHPAAAWRYYRVEVPALTPTGAPLLGWELRLLEASANTTEVVVRRDLVPPGGGNIGLGATAWASGGQVSLISDLTGRPISFDGTKTWEGSHYVLLAMGRPLQPGSYLVGVRNTGTSPIDWTLRSRGVGEGMSVAPVVVDFAGGEAAWPDLAPRDLAVFAVDVPANQRSWVVEAAFSRGEGRMIVAGGALPGSDASFANTVGTTLPSPSVASYKAGNERLAVFPASNQDFLPAGRYHAVVIAEGENLTGTRIGNGSVAGSLRSLGALVPIDGGVLAPGDTFTTMLTLGAGELVSAAVVTTPEVLLLEARMTERTGPANLGMAWRTGERLPPPVSTIYRYSPSGGPAADVSGADTVVRVNPPAGPHRLTLGPSDTHYFQSGSAARDLGTAQVTLTLRAVQPIPLAFDPALASPEVPATVAGQLVDAQRALHVIDVPESLNGEPILGMLLNLQTSLGSASLRAHFDYTLIQNGATMAAGWRLIAPPFLRPGRWYVEVTGSGNTAYTLSSQAALLRRPAFVLPAAGVVQPPPGLTGSFIGDSGVALDGTPLPADQGIDLGLTEFHFYAVEVDPANAGLLRVELVALNGNPDLYLQEGNLPSPDHSNGTSNWNGSSAFLRQMTGTGTEYASFVPLAGRISHRLSAGTHYLAVRATGSSARYRLRLQSGNVLGGGTPIIGRLVQELPANGTLVDGQPVAAGDWRYFRVPIPAEPTTTLRVTFVENSGDVRLHVRHGAPPGHGTTSQLPGASSPIDWVNDNLNFRPDPGPWDLPGVVNLAVPPLRPGDPLYLGFFGKTDVTFSVSAEWIGPETPVAFAPFTLLPYNGGSAEITLPPSGRATWRIFVPAEATRWKHSSTHAGDVWVYLEQGAPPPETTSAHRSHQNTVNSSFNQFLETWPWIAGRTYYLTAVNKSTTEERSFAFALDGRDESNDDNDNDGLLDAWERLYFGNTNATAAADPDGDGLSNLREFEDGTDPTDPASALYRLALSGRGAVAAVEPAGNAHERWTPLALSAVADEPAHAVRWWRFLDNPLDRNSVGRLAGRLSGTVQIPTAGDWTFHVRTMVALELKLGGVTVYTRDTSGAVQEAFLTLNLPAGALALEAVLAANSGQDALELGAAPGTLAAWDSAAFRVLGDAAGGGLAVTTAAGLPGLDLEVREPMINVAVTRVTAPDLLAGTAPVRWRAGGVVPTADLQDRASFTGRYAEAWPYPRVIAGASLGLASEGDTAVEVVAGLEPAEGLALAGAVNLPPAPYVPWLGIADPTAPGGMAARSGWVDGLGRSELWARVSGSGSLRFHWRVSATTSSTTLVLERRTNGGTAVIMGTLSATSGWLEVVTALPAGEHDLRFRFRRAGDASAAEDFGTVAELSWLADPTLAEAVDAPYLNWAGSGAIGWLGTRAVTFDGVDAARSGGITHNQESLLTTTVTGPGTLAFRWKVSSEANRDFLSLRLDGSELYAISGEVDWELRELILPEGTFTLTWRYAKDGSINAGADAGWVDTVSFTPDDAYDAWLLLAGLTGPDALYVADPDLDGVANLAEYTFSLNPRVADRRGLAAGGVSGLPRAWVEETLDGPRLVVELVARRDPKLAITVRFGDRPETATTAGVAELVETLGDVERIHYRDPAETAGTARFAVVEISR